MKTTVVYLFSLFILIIGSDGMEDDRSMKIRNKRLDGLVGGLLDQMVAERLERKKILEDFQAFKTQVGDIGKELKVRNNLLQDTKLLQKKLLRDVKDMKEEVQEVAKIAMKKALKGVYSRISKVENQGIRFSNEIIYTKNALKRVSTRVDGTNTRVSRVEQRCHLIWKEVKVLKKKSESHWKQIAFSTKLDDSPTTSSALMFRTVITNIGGGYSVRDGMFNCPINGLYILTITLEGRSRSNVYGSIMKNNQIAAYVHEHGAHGGYQSVSVTIAFRLVYGDKIWVKGTGIRYNSNCYFTGVYVGP